MLAWEHDGSCMHHAQASRHAAQADSTRRLQAVVRAMLERVWERGDIYKANYEGAPPAPTGVCLALPIRLHLQQVAVPELSCTVPPSHLDRVSGWRQ